MLDHLANTTAWLAFRARLARTLRSGEAALASREELEALVSTQTDWWEKRGSLRSLGKTRALAALNERSIRTYIFSVRAGKISVWKKVPSALPVADKSRQPGLPRRLARRAGLCKIYLERVLGMSGNEGSFDFALDVGDRPGDTEAFPVFGFQRDASSHNIVLPDPDFFDYDWYRRDDDPLTYEAKEIRACFAGVSTGGRRLDADAIRNVQIPRLRAAAYFHGNPDVLFRISAAVQCESPDVASLLRAQPYFGPHIPWRDQLRNRFIISMDGNAATWSRMARALLSNSAVIKYRSSAQLFYFPALQAGREYISVDSDVEVQPIIRKEREQPGAYRHVAQAGHLFAKRYLSAPSVFSYTALLMRRIAQMQ
jgi:hypothetical protein